MQLNLLVLRCKNIEITKNFYEKIGLEFEKEQHGKGVEHYATYVGKMLLELYPLTKVWLFASRIHKEYIISK